MRNEDIRVFDIETNNNPDNFHVWGVAEVPLWTEEKPTIYNNIADYCEHLTKTKKSFKLFAHWAKFDKHPVINYLVRHKGYELLGDNEKARSKTISQIISADGTFYQAKIFVKVYKTRNIVITIWDSYNKVSMSLEDAAEAYGLETKKGIIDYDRERPKGYKMNKQEIDYLVNDVIILKKILQEQYKAGRTRMTKTMDAFNELKSTIDNFDYLFPKLTNQVDMKIRRGYTGAINLINYDKANQDLNNVTTYDINSMYSYIMREYPMPIGEPVMFEGKDGINHEHFSFYIVDAIITAKLKKGHYPILRDQNQNGRLRASTVREMNGELFTLSTYNHKILFENYDVENIEYIGGYMFRTASGIFTKFIDTKMKIKENPENPAQRQMAKDDLNSSYGNFGKKLQRRNKIQNITKEGTTYQTTDTKTITGVYLPVAIAIIDGAKWYMSQHINNNKETFIYCDTDSIHLQEGKHNIPIHQTKIGMFKEEHKAHKAHYVKLKTYALKKENEDIITIAGLQTKQQTQLKFEDIRKGNKFTNKQMIDIGEGYVTVDTTFTI